MRKAKFLYNGSDELLSSSENFYSFQEIDTNLVNIEEPVNPQLPGGGCTLILADRSIYEVFIQLDSTSFSKDGLNTFKSFEYDSTKFKLRNENFYVDNDTYKTNLKYPFDFNDTINTELSNQRRFPVIETENLLNNVQFEVTRKFMISSTLPRVLMSFEIQSTKLIMIFKMGYIMVVILFNELLLTMILH